jgi:hypothetical protein
MNARLLCVVGALSLLAGQGPAHSQIKLKSLMVAVPTGLAVNKVTDFKAAVPAAIASQSNIQLQPAGAAVGQLTGARIVSPTTSLDVFIAPQDKVTALANEVAAAVTREGPERRSILTDVQKSFQNQRAPTLIMLANQGSPIDFGTISFVRNTAAATAIVQDVPIAVASSAERAVTTLSVNETIATQLLQAQVAQQIDWSTFRFLPARDDINKSLGPPAFQPLARAYGAVTDAYLELLKAPTSAAAQRKLTQTAEDYRTTYIATFRATESDPAARRAAADAHNALARQMQLKAIYNVDTNFAPPSYRQIYNFSRRVIRIRASGQTICSGLALSQHWVATAGHCLAGRRSSDIQVVFEMDDAGTAVRTVAVVDAWPSPAPGANNQDPIDYVFLRVAPNPDITNLFASLEPTAATADTPEGLCIRSQALGFKEPVFAIGYPRGERKSVHDYSYVWFPFRVTEAEFTAMEAETFARAKLVGDQVSEREYADRVVASLREAYKTAADQQRYYYGSETGTAPRPSFGIDTDTFHGNSGSPVFDRRNRCLVGIFSGGARDQLRVPESSWKQHEFAIPITEVVTHLEKVPEQAGVSPDVKQHRADLVKMLQDRRDTRAN